MSNFSGYLLAWDQLSYWAVTIAISMLGYIPVIGTTLQEIMWGGGEVDAATLQLFYTIHTTILPLSLLFLMVYHFWLIRRAGGVLLPVRHKNIDKVKQSLPINELLIRELSLAAVVTCVLLLFAMSVNAPLGDMANPQLTPTNIKAPWYFLGVQELLLHVHPVVAVFILPLSVTLFLILLPFLKTRLGKGRVSVKILFVAGTIFMRALTITGIWFRGPDMPDNARVHYNLGQLKVFLRRDEEAEVALQRTIVIEPGNINYLEAIARFYLERHQFIKAGNIGEQMIEQHPDNPFGRQLLDFLKSKGQLPEH